MPTPVIRAFGLLKKAAALANITLGALEKQRGWPCCRPLTKSSLENLKPTPTQLANRLGTQTNMNANEVIANRANELLGLARG